LVFRNLTIIFAFIANYITKKVQAMSEKVKLGVNIDHVATLRNARGEGNPDIIRAAAEVAEAGADLLTVHLREDRRHIKDRDVYDLKEQNILPLNLEIAATEEMLSIALDVKPYACCIVPEKREELTTEGGLNVIDNLDYLKSFCQKLQEAGIVVSLFIDPDLSQIDAASEVGADFVELHTGSYCNLKDDVKRQGEFDKILRAVEYANKNGIKCNAGHGLTYETTEEIIKIPNIEELNIGHFIISEALFIGLDEVVRKFVSIINQKQTLQ
jgi:pyridoxine 5-phosphate synthase